MAADTRGLASGFTQGFGLMDNYYNRQAQNDRAERGLQMREESFQMQKDDRDRQRKREQATMIYGKVSEQLPLAEEEMQFLRDNPTYLAALNPEVDAGIEVSQRVIDPNDPLDLNDDESVYAMNTMFEPMINRGKGGKKRIVAGIPGQRKGTLAFELEVEGEDGKTYRAPMTANRGIAGQDDEIKQVPVEDLVNTVQGYRTIRNVINSRGARDYAAKMYSLLTGKKPEQRETWSEPFEYQGGRYQRSNLTGQLRELQSPEDVRKGSEVGAELTPQQEVYAKRLQSEVDHLWRMERQIQTGQGDGMNIFLGGMEETVTPDNRDQLLSDIRTRIRANEQELNKLLGVSAPQQGFDAIIQEAENVPPEQREQELADLKSDPRVPYTVVRQIEEMWGMGGRAPQPSLQPTSGQSQQPQTQPQPGLQRPEPQREPATQTSLEPAVNERPGANPRSGQPINLEDPNAGRDWREQQVGPMIESGVKSVGDAISTRANKNINEAARELSRIAKGESEPYQGNIRQYLMNNPEALMRLSPADLQRLQQRYGERFINQFL